MLINEMLDDLKNGYYSPGHPLFRSGQNKIYDYFKGQLPNKEIKKFLSKDYAYTIHRLFSSKSSKIKKSSNHNIFVYQNSCKSNFLKS